MTEVADRAPRAKVLMVKPLLVLAMLLVTFAAIEAMARLTYRFLYGEYARGLPSGAPAAASVDEQIEQMKFLDPFYGYVSKELDEHRQLLPGRRHGRDVAVPRQGEGNAFVVAIVGGSVADDVAAELRTALLQRFSEFRPRLDAEPALVNLANPGFHQPQQAAVLVNMLASGARLDVVVNLDGFNDVGRIARDRDVLGPYTLVNRAWITLSSANDHRAKIAGIRQLREEERELLAAHPWEDPLYGSAVFGLLRRYRLDRIERMIALEHHELADAIPSSMSDYYNGRLIDLMSKAMTGHSADGFFRIGPDSWCRGSRLMAGVVEKLGARYYHFLQPSQYVPGAKPLSDDERDNAFALRHRPGREYRKAYPLLMDCGRRLQAEGVKFFDLSDIFAGHTETLYVDICCHLNQRGDELLAEHMMRRIVANERFVEASPLSGRPLLTHEDAVLSAGDAAAHVRRHRNDGTFLRPSAP